MGSGRHGEWLSLVEVSGPFVSPPVLERVFPQGLDVVGDDVVVKTRRAYEEWSDDRHSPAPELAVHEAWVRFVVTDTLGFTPEVLAEGGAVPESVMWSPAGTTETVRPDLVVVDPDDGTPRMLVEWYDPGQDLEGLVPGAGWAVSPAERMVQSCRATGVPLGLVTNGERWMLVSVVGGESSGLASWYASLWWQEPLTFRAFVSLLGVRRFFGVADEDRLDALLAESVSYQAEVTDQLGLQVRRAVEVLVAAFDRADADSGRTLLAEVTPGRVYEAALTVMMRLVFLFTAEERGLLSLGDPTYDGFYAVSTLRGQLREAADQVGEEVLERRQDAWSRLLATFRAIYGGVRHEDLHIVPYGSSLFDPDRFPFLEGRPDGTSWRDTEASPLPVDNRTVLLLLESLQVLDMGPKRGARTLSFRSLDVEQIGHVYETLLDHTARRATEPMVSLRGAKKGTARYEPELPVAALHRLLLDDEDSLIDWLHDETKKTKPSLRKALTATNVDPREVARLQAACRGDDVLLAQLLPFHSLIRTDPWGDPVVIHPGSLYVTAGEDRRTTGTHYTPRALTEEIVQYALEPVVYEGPAAGADRDDWVLKTPEVLLGVRVCDPAMGSGAFLVQACRYLSERLVEAWDRVEVNGPFDVEGRPCPPAEAVPQDRDERLRLARRLVADRCLYGVDVNPLAVEMAKLSLWLITLAKDRPFTFIDHALRCGDSLLGISEERQVARFAIDVDEAARIDDGSLFADFTPMVDALERAAELRRRLTRAREIDIYDVDAKTRLHAEADQAVADARLVADAIVALELVRPTTKKALGVWADQRQTLADRLRDYLTTHDPQLRRTLTDHIRHLLDTDLPAGKPPRRPFHWPIEYPEIFHHHPDPGFDAMTTNPPFLGGKRISGAMGSAYREYLTRELGNGIRGNADLVAFFFLRMAQLTSETGTFGAIATNTIGQGDTREVGLDQLLDRGWRVYRTDPARPWPGTAAVEVAVVWLSRVDSLIPVRAGEEVDAIGSDLETQLPISGRPARLEENEGVAFVGTYVLGRGFVLEPPVALELIRQDARNRDVLRPYINGEDLNSRPDLSPSRWVIDFDDMSESEANTYEAVWKIALERIKPERETKDAEKYPTMVSEWWKHWNPRRELYRAVSRKERALAVAGTSSVLAFAFLPTDIVYSHALYVFALDRWSDFATLQSILHDLWVRRFTSSLETRLRYTATDAFETFPRPEPTERMEATGEAFYVARQELMRNENLGLTAVHNRINDPADQAPETRHLRDLWHDMDLAVAAAYRWSDLELRRVFRQTRHGRRWTLTVAEETEVLTRLLRLNLERAGSGE